MSQQPVAPHELAHELLADLAHSRRTSDSPEQKRALAQLAALVEIGDRLRDMEQLMRQSVE